MIELKNNEKLPHDYKFNLKKFFEKVFSLSGKKEYSKAEKKINGFLKSSLYTNEDKTRLDFYNSFSDNFSKKLEQLRDLNGNEPFEHIEIITPYITRGETIIRQALTYVKENNLLLTIPYGETNKADITQENYEKFAKIGIKWAKFIEPGKEKGFRFNHSKIYRFHGKTQMHTIVGSVNFTEAAWKGVNKHGNVESAVIYTEPVNKWEPWLTPDNNADIEFAEKQGDETEPDNRKDVPNISFVLDWNNKILSYRLKETRQFSGKVLLDGDTGKILQIGKNKINLTPEWVKILSLNSVIKIRFNGDIFYFYPEQIGIENKPLSLKLKMTDQELISLWKNISIKDDNKSQISNLIELYIRAKTDKEGDLFDDETNTKRTINLMAAHISALINLEETLYKIPPLVREYDAAKEIFQYYLYTHNIDTIKGYREMLLAMYKDEDLLPGFYWLLLKIIKKEFYNKRKNNAFYRAVRGETGKLQSTHTATMNDIDAEINTVEKDLKGVKNFDNKLINWIKTELKKMYLNEETAARLINMNPFPEKGFIDNDVAKRQFNVILKGFNHLNQVENNFLYIADEVGLGKTYIAIGIASLFRYFSSTPENYLDTILVPKQNLQFKWLKEIKNFITNNYCQKDNRVRSIIGKPVAQLNQESIIHRLGPFKSYGSRYVLIRNSSFSVASYGEDGDNTWIENLKNNLPLEQKKYFIKFQKKFSRKNIIIKRAYAYLLNTLMPEIDLLIVDEAHNFKHGVNDSVSTRNQVVSRLLGACDEDEELFSLFPDLKNRIQPKVKKLLLLSATPIDNSLTEIGNQLDCFLKDHRFKNITDKEKQVKAIEKDLNQFMIRGVMHLTLNGNKFSRNGYRHEHRFGNVKKQEIAETQILNDNRTAAFLGLLQYKTIKELKLKNNNSFEMGMLAGFESFAGKSEYENRTIDDKAGREPKDQKIIEDLVNSYNKEFDEYPPHPKQESLVNELLSLIQKRQKAMVFVRRIASVKEIERKLFQKYSHYLIQKIKVIKGRQTIPALEVLLKSFEDDKIRDEIETVLNTISDRIYPEIKSALLSQVQKNNGDDQYLQSTLKASVNELYNSLIEDTALGKFKEKVKDHAGLFRIKKELKDLTISLLKRKWDNDLILEDEDEDELSASEKTDEEKAPYFFQRFFYNEGKNFKKRSYNKNWYEINYLLLNDRFDLFELDCEKLKQTPELSKVKTESKKFEVCQTKIEQAIKSKQKSKCEIDEVFRTNTFLNVLLTDLCEQEFASWINTHKKLISENNISAFLEKLASLVEILKSIFRQGSGLLPAFIADAKSKNGYENNFIGEMKILLSGEFNFVLQEIKDVISDYDKLIQTNFDDTNRIRYNLIQQLPVAGVSGHHRKDVRKMAIQFRMPGYPYVLIATDILKEGEDLHSYCSNIYHYGIAWNPSDMEQRTGRIDRIGSLTYRNINNIPKEHSDIPFEEKLQVFYPYLADTLEVNQMVKLFKGMAEFINIFYNDISKGIEKNAKADVDCPIVSIPQQNTGLLVSKYDYDDFNLECDQQATLKFQDHIGVHRDLLKMSLEKIFTRMRERENRFIIDPELDETRLIISGVMQINGKKSDEFRNGPFIVSFDQDKKPGHFVLVLESCLGKIQVFGQKSNQRIVEDRLSDKNIVIVEKNNDVWTKIKIDDFQDPQSVVCELVSLICITDELEEQITGEDLVIDF